jgi:hypothetical protein
MILIRYKNDSEPKIVFEGTESEVIEKIHSLNLCDYHDTFFYERGKFENLGINANHYEFYDYYVIYDSIDEYNKWVTENAKRERRD